MKKSYRGAFDYGEYKRLVADPRYKAAVRGLVRVAKALGVRYAVVGGLATYLHVKNPPIDYPDVDVVVDESADKAERFVERLRREKGWRMEFFDAGLGTDIFATFTFRGAVQVDIFSSQEARKWLRRTVRRGGLRLERPEPLVVEKVIRGTEADNLMAIDLLAAGGYDPRLLYEVAREYNASGRIRFLEKIARAFAAGRLNKSGIRAIAKRMTGQP